MGAGLVLGIGILVTTVMGAGDNRSGYKAPKAQSATSMFNLGMEFS